MHVACGAWYRKTQVGCVPYIFFVYMYRVASTTPSSQLSGQVEASMPSAGSGARGADWRRLMRERPDLSRSIRPSWVSSSYTLSLFLSPSLSNDAEIYLFIFLYGSENLEKRGKRSVAEISYRVLILRILLHSCPIVYTQFYIESVFLSSMRFLRDFLIIIFIII